MSAHGLERWLEEQGPGAALTVDAARHFEVLMAKISVSSLSVRLSVLALSRLQCPSGHGRALIQQLTFTFASCLALLTRTYVFMIVLAFLANYGTLSPYCMYLILRQNVCKQAFCFTACATAEEGRH